MDRVSRENFSRPVESTEVDAMQPPQLVPVSSASRPRIFRSPNDPDLGTPLNVTNSLGTMLPGNWVSLNGPEEQYVSPAPDRGGNGKKNRLPSQNQQAADRSRRDRAAYVLDQSMRTTQKASMRERRHRGVIVDAWLKCRTLPDGYDSDDDKLGRAAGLHDVADDDVDATDAAKLAFVGDIGAQDEVLAKAWRKLGRTMGIPAFARRSRTAHRQMPKNGHDEEIIILDDVNAAEGGGVIVIDDNESAIASTPAANAAAKRKRAPPKRKSRAAAVVEGDATPRTTPSRAAPGTGRRRTTVKKPGTEGVPLKDWTGKESTPTAGRNSTTRRVASVKYPDKQEEDAMDSAAHEPPAGRVKGEEEEPVENLDAELLGDAAEADDGEGGEDAVPDDEEAAELLMGMTGSSKEHGAALMMEAEKSLDVKKGQGEVHMIDV